jgi:hypothetical protein
MLCVPALRPPAELWCPEPTIGCAHLGGAPVSAGAKKFQEAGFRDRTPSLVSLEGGSSCHPQTHHVLARGSVCLSPTPFRTLHGSEDGREAALSATSHSKPVRWGWMRPPPHLLTKKPGCKSQETFFFLLFLIY